MITMQAYIPKPEDEAYIPKPDEAYIPKPDEQAITIRHHHDGEGGGVEVARLQA